MKFFCTQVETTGLIPQIHEVIELASIVIDTDYVEQIKTPADLFKFHIFHGLAMPQGQWRWSSRAAEIHEESGLLQRAKEEGLDSIELIDSFQLFLLEHQSRETGRPRTFFCGDQFAGFGFPFLKESNFLEGMHASFRVIDLTDFWTDWAIDAEPPTFAQCLERARIPPLAEKGALSKALKMAELKVAQINQLSRNCARVALID